MQIKRYTPSDRAAWDTFVTASRNGTFLFYRDYMEYHQDRFTDHSLLFYDDKEQLLALLPANEQEQCFDSHGGLSYGGFIVGEGMKIPKMLEAFAVMLLYAQNTGFGELRYKTVPHIYHQSPAEEDRYVLHLLGAKCHQRSVIAAVNLQHPLPFQSRRTRGSQKARKQGILIRETTELATYWQILSDLLAATHQATPVHSLAEITTLQQRFPQHIRLHAAFEGETMLAGVLIYETPQVARAQYIAANPAGQASGALDLLFDDLLHEVYAHKPFFEFGTSHVPHTPNAINRGLIDQKEGFGARTIIQDTYYLHLQGLDTEILQKALV